jgi:hypothetical protein
MPDPMHGQATLPNATAGSMLSYRSPTYASSLMSRWCARSSEEHDRGAYVD